MERTCVVTKQKMAVADLLRFTVSDGHFVFDGQIKKPGRGGYVIKDEKALDRLIKMKGKIKHQLKVLGDFEILEAELEKGKHLCE